MSKSGFIVEGLSALQKSLSRLSRSDTISAVLMELGEKTKTKTKHALEKKRDPDTGIAWPAVLVASKKPRKGQDSWKAPLHRSGRLGDRAGEYQSDARSLEVLSGMEYAMYHQEGRGHLPLRRFIPTDSKWYNNNFRSLLKRSMKL